MEVVILDHREAEIYTPSNETLAIRIYDSYAPNNGTTPLQTSDNWADILEFTFDDIELDRYPEEYLLDKLPEWEIKFALFNPKLAKKIINSFGVFLDISHVMLHCTWGWKRSPAVIRGLEHYYDLDLKWAEGRTHRIMTSEPDGKPWCGNSHVYKLLCDQKLKN